jgi:hypothetical protein
MALFRPAAFPATIFVVTCFKSLSRKFGTMKNITISGIDLKAVSFPINALTVRFFRRGSYVGHWE